MAIAFRQLITASVTSEYPTTVFLPADPFNGSTLIAVVACIGTAGVTLFRHTGVEWNLLYEADGPVVADEQALEAVRVQIWGAFNVQNTISQIGILFTGATTKRGIIVAEYTGDVFQFPNPADRVVGDVGQTPASTIGTLDTGAGGVTREEKEIWVGGGALDQRVDFQAPVDSPFEIRSQIDIGSPAGGRMVLLDSIDSDTIIQAVQMRVDHAPSGSITNWAAVMAALRGAIQVPNPGVDEPTVGEPVTENTDHEGVAIGHLLEQFKSHD